MKIWEVAYQLNILESSGPARSTGLHCSDVIRDLALRGNILDRKWANKIQCGCGEVLDEISIVEHQCGKKHLATRTDDMSPERIELGIAWEERLPKHHPEICFHPGEIMVDGISMTIDGASHNDGERTIFGCDADGALHEFKLTWKSSRSGVDGQWMWMTQMKSYLYGMRATGMLKTNVAFLHVYWVMGNYSRDQMDVEGGPRYKIYGIEFSDLEIKECWQMLTIHSKRMGVKLERVRR